MRTDKDSERYTMKGYFQCALTFCALTVCFAGEKDVKRLLLNDPDVINDRLNRMENMLSILNTTVKQQSLTIQLQKSEIKQLQSAEGKMYQLLLH